MADRLSIGSQYLSLIEQLDNADVLDMKSSGDRSDMYMVALALGVDKGVRTPSKSKEGIIRDTTANGKDSLMSYIYSIAVDELRKNGQENQITDNNVVYGIAEEYANTGLEIISEMIPDFSKYDKEEFEFTLIQMMDDLVE